MFESRQTKGPDGQQPDLRGLRILILGADEPVGRRLAETLSRGGARLVVAVRGALSPYVDWQKRLAETAEQAIILPFDRPDGALAKSALEPFGGLDLILNVMAMTPDATQLDGGDLESFESAVSSHLNDAVRVGGVFGNRLRLTRAEGHVIHVAVLHRGLSPAAAFLAPVLRAELAALTATEARHWAEFGITVNSIWLEDEPDDLTETASDGSELEAIILDMIRAEAQPRSGLIFAGGTIPACV